MQLVTFKTRRTITRFALLTIWKMPPWIVVALLAIGAVSA